MPNPSQSETDRLTQWMIRHIQPKLPMQAAKARGMIERAGFGSAEWRLAKAKDRAGIVSRRSGRRWPWTTERIEQQRGHYRKMTQAEILAEMDQARPLGA